MGNTLSQKPKDMDSLNQATTNPLALTEIYNI